MYRKDKARLAFKIIVVLLLVVAGSLAVVHFGKMVIKANEIPTVYMVHGDQDTCVRATDAEGNPTTCAEAMKDGVYHTEWVAPKTLNEN